jgi:hypothetical protein
MEAGNSACREHIVALIHVTRHVSDQARLNERR